MGIFDIHFIAPYLADAQIIPLGEYSLSQKEKDGQLYQVFTQDFILFPEKSGNFTILPASFKAAYRQQNKRDTFALMDSFIFQPIGRKEIVVRAKPIEIKVLPRPKETLNQWWLPSSDVTLSEEWSELENVKVGQPITRRIQLKALNVLGNMLPDINIQSSENFKVYGENIQKTQMYEKNVGLIGYETRNFVFVPLKAGELTLPSVVVNWFDVSSSTLKKAILPSKNINVVADLELLEAENQIKMPKQNKEKVNANDVLSKPFEKENKKLYFLAGLSIGLIIALLTISIFYLRHRRKNKLPELYPQNK